MSFFALGPLTPRSMGSSTSLSIPSMEGSKNLAMYGFNGTSGGTTKYDGNMKNVNDHDWSSLGHTTSVTNIGGSIFGLIGANHGSTDDTTIFNS